MKNIILIAIFAALVMVSGCSNSDEVSMAELKVLTLDGEETTLAKYKGQKVFLTFWATWCGHCRQELPGILKAHEQMEKEGYAFVMVSDESLETLNKFKKIKPFPFDSYKLPKSVKMLGIFSIPQTYLINSKGEVVESLDGIHDWSSEKGLAMLRSVE